MFLSAFIYVHLRLQISNHYFCKRSNDYPNTTNFAALYQIRLNHALTIAKTLRSLNHQPTGLVGSEAVFRLERFALGGVVRHEEVLDLVDKVLVQVVEGSHVAMVAGVGGNGEQAIVALGFAFLSLKSIKAADETRRDEAADKSRLLHQNQHVDGVAVVG